MLTTLCLAILLQDPALDAWKKFVEIRTEMAEVRKTAQEALKQDQKDPEARKAIADANSKERAGREAFIKAFASAKTDGYKPEEHGEMLSVGWSSQAAAAVKAGDIEGAADLYAKVVELPAGPGIDGTRLSYGDVLAALGRTEQALAEYAKVPETNKGLYRYAEQRLAVIGKPAPEIDSKTWIGGDAKALSAFKGQPVVVDFWATWCGPCRAVMPGLSEMYAAHKKEGLVVLGVTRFYKNGYMPANADQMMSGGQSVRDLTQETFLPHVEAFKTNTGIEYPFVVAEEGDMKNYKVSGIPTIVVVDREGKVAMLLVGSGSEPLVKAAVKRMLADKGENARPAKP